MDDKIIRVSTGEAPKIALWLEKRGGVAVWPRLNLSNCGSAFVPVKQENGEPTQKPSWQYANAPERIITDPNEVRVFVPVVVARFHVAVRRSSNGMMLKLTDGSSERLRRALEKHGPTSNYYFDYDEVKNCVITVQKDEKTLLEFLAEKITEKIA